MSTQRADSMFLRPSTLAERAQERLECERTDEPGPAPTPARTLRVPRPPAPDYVTVMRLEPERAEENGQPPVGRTFRVPPPPAPDHITVINV